MIAGETLPVDAETLLRECDFDRLSSPRNVEHTDGSQTDAVDKIAKLLLSKEQKGPEYSKIYEVQVAAGKRLFEKYKKTQRELEMKRKAVPAGCTFAPDIHKSQEKFTHTIQSDSSKPAFQRLLDAGAKKEQKLEQSREEAATLNCTFTPEILEESRRIASANSEAPTTTEEIFDSLFSDSNARRQKLEQLQKAVIEKEEKEFGEQRRKLTKAAAEVGLEKYAQQQQKHISILHEVKQVKDAKLKELEEKKAEIELRECSFQPNVSKRAEQPEEKQEKCYDRLHCDAKEKTQRLAEERKAAQDQQLSQCSFRPNIGQSATEPLTEEAKQKAHERLHGGKDAHASKAQKRLALQQKLDQENAITFKPKLNAHSLSLAKKQANTDSGVDCNERLFALYSSHQKKQEQNEAKRVAKELEEIRACTHRPKISRNSRKIFDEHSKRTAACVYDRLYSKAKQPDMGAMGAAIGKTGLHATPWSSNHSKLAAARP